MAMIARGYLKLDPFEVWGDGEQIRNWTYVDDIVSGTIAAAEKIHDGTSINLGTMERIKVKDCAQQVIDTLNPGATIKLLTDKPTGPLNRVASNALAQELLDWSPQTKFSDGLQKTIDWYVSTKKYRASELGLKPKTGRQIKISSDQKITILKPSAGWTGFDFAGIWQYRDLLYLLVRRDFLAQYKQTILGPAWFVLQPLFLTVVFTLILENLPRFRPKGSLPYSFIIRV